MNKKTNIILVVLLVAVSGLAFYFYQKVSSLKESPSAAQDKEAAELVAKVGKLIVLPAGETPTIATVSDPTKLKDQPFFAKAKLGDKVLLYPNSKKAYLYDPVANKVMEVAPINLGDASKAPAKPAPKPEDVKKTNQ